MGADAVVGVGCPVDVPFGDENQVSLMDMVDLVFDEIEPVARHQIIYFIMIMLMLAGHGVRSVQFIVQHCEPDSAHTMIPPSSIIIVPHIHSKGKKC